MYKLDKLREKAIYFDENDNIVNGDVYKDLENNFETTSYKNEQYKDDMFDYTEQGHILNGRKNGEWITKEYNRYGDYLGKKVSLYINGKRTEIKRYDADNKLYLCDNKLYLCDNIENGKYFFSKDGFTMNEVKTDDDKGYETTESQSTYKDWKFYKCINESREFPYNIIYTTQIKNDNPFFYSHIERIIGDNDEFKMKAYVFKIYYPDGKLYMHIYKDYDKDYTVLSKYDPREENKIEFEKVIPSSQIQLGDIECSYNVTYGMEEDCIKDIDNAKKRVYNVCKQILEMNKDL